MEDEQIIGLYWSRNEGAIRASEDKYGAYCRAIAMNILSSIPDAEESVNDTWLGAWNAIPPQRPAILSAFFGAITRRISLNRRRDARTQKRGGGQAELALDELSEIVPASSSVEEAIEEKELAGAVDAFLRTLPETERRVFLRRYWYLDSISDIARRFGFSESKTKSMLHRCRGKLLSHLRKGGYISI